MSSVFIEWIKFLSIFFTVYFSTFDYNTGMLSALLLLVVPLTMND